MFSLLCSCCFWARERGSIDRWEEESEIFFGDVQTGNRQEVWPKVRFHQWISWACKPFKWCVTECRIMNQCVSQDWIAWRTHLPQHAVSSEKPNATLNFQIAFNSKMYCFKCLFWTKHIIVNIYPKIYFLDGWIDR